MPFFSMHRKKRLFLSLFRGQNRKGVFLDASGKTKVLISFLSPFYISIYIEKKEEKEIYIRIWRKWGQIDFTLFFPMHREKRPKMAGDKLGTKFFKTCVFSDASRKTRGTKWGQKPEILSPYYLSISETICICPICVPLYSDNIVCIEILSTILCKFRKITKTTSMVDNFFRYATSFFLSLIFSDNIIYFPVFRTFVKSSKIIRIIACPYIFSNNKPLFLLLSDGLIITRGQNPEGQCLFFGLRHPSGRGSFHLI